MRLLLITLLALTSPLFAQKIATPPPTKPPFEAVDITKLPEGATQLDLFLLMGQSNMKGRGLMPAEPKRDPRIVMMHLKDDQWYLARHPLHLTGDTKTFQGHDNAGVGPGLTFAEAMAAANPKAAIGLVPCAVGGSSIKLWQKGARLYDEALRRAELALHTTAPANARIRGVIWLQGEANAKPEELPQHAARLRAMIEALRADLALPELPFIACTIGEMKGEPLLTNLKAMNDILLALPKTVPHTACVDARDLKTHIGDAVHFDTAAQNEIGKRFAAKFIELSKP
ncbi:MAG: sialate O-acetylesterase [Prosthecobacter sp.]|uniref:sialate O-acetylesterase n=1 Tax=Prosthecobacter sp. TaxID=1965333 RepID=UPI003901EDC7